jgi:hypothetical protein
VRGYHVCARSDDIGLAARKSNYRQIAGKAGRKLGRVQ